MLYPIKYIPNYIKIHYIILYQDTVNYTITKCNILNSSILHTSKKNKNNSHFVVKNNNNNNNLPCLTPQGNMCFASWILIHHIINFTDSKLQNHY